LDFVQEIVENFSNWSIFGRLADSLFFKTARNMGSQILMKGVSNYIAGHISQGGLKFATQISPLLNLHYLYFQLLFFHFLFFLISMIDYLTMLLDLQNKNLNYLSNMKLLWIWPLNSTI
jgi:hypothetical protein